MKIEDHNNTLFKIWKSGLLKNDRFAYCVIGTDIKGEQFALYAMPKVSKEHVIRILRETADSLEKDSNKIIKPVN